VYLLVGVQFITQPSNLTICLGDVAVFTCEVDTNGIEITVAQWQVLQQDLGFVSVSNIIPPFQINITNYIHEDTLTSRLMIANITSDYNGTTYRCYITPHVVSYTAQLIVAGMNIHTHTHTHTYIYVATAFMNFTHIQ